MPRTKTRRGRDALCTLWCSLKLLVSVVRNHRRAAAGIHSVKRQATFIKNESTADAHKDSVAGIDALVAVIVEFQTIGLPRGCGRQIVFDLQVINRKSVV